MNLLQERTDSDLGLWEKALVLLTFNNTTGKSLSNILNVKSWS